MPVPHYPLSPPITTYNDQGESVEGKGDILAAFIAKTLIDNYDTEPDELGGEDIIYYLTGMLKQARTDLAMVCQALETGDATT